jgi:hypothetical protein
LNEERKSDLRLQFHETQAFPYAAVFDQHLRHSLPRLQFYQVADLPQVPLVVENDVALDPVDLGLFGADGVMFGPYGVADAVEQSFSWGFDIISSTCVLRLVGVY